MAARTKEIEDTLVINLIPNEWLSDVVVLGLSDGSADHYNDEHISKFGFCSSNDRQAKQKRNLDCTLGGAKDSFSSDRVAVAKHMRTKQMNLSSTEDDDDDDGCEGAFRRSFAATVFIRSLWWKGVLISAAINIFQSWSTSLCQTDAPWCDMAVGHVVHLA